MNKVSRVEAILDAWLEFIALDNYSQATIKLDKNSVQLDGVKLEGNHIFIEPNSFSQLQQVIRKQERSKQEKAWVLSFPRFFKVAAGKRIFHPLFSLDVTPILARDYHKDGWEVDDLVLSEPGKNLVTFLGLDEEQSEQLVTQEGLRKFLETTFEQDFATYEDWMKQIRVSGFQIEPQPYLFEFKGGAASWHLKPEIEEIKCSAKKWLKPKHPAYEYLFSTPELPKHEVTYAGAFLTDEPPDNSQSTVLKHAQSEPLTAVQGPPGSGKTTLILHLIAQQFVKRALNLIETGEDINNLVVISSNTNKAVDNVVEKLNAKKMQEVFNNNLLYLKGGNKDNINSEGGALEKLQEAINFLQKNSFDKNRHSDLAKEIKQIKEQLIIGENNYIQERRQRCLDQESREQIQEELQRLKVDLEEALFDKNQSQRRVSELEEYNQLPFAAYEELEVLLDTAELQLPKAGMSWWKKIWFWINGRTEGQVLAKIAVKCQPTILKTLNTPFALQVPRSREELIEKALLVRERVKQAKELQNVQRKLNTSLDNISATQRTQSELSTNLALLNAKLEMSLEDFYATFHIKYNELHKQLFILSREYLIQQALGFKKDVIQTLKLYSDVLCKNEKAKNRMAEKLDEHIKTLSLIFPVITSGLLSMRNMLPWLEECVDRTIIDEAGMIPLHQSFPLLVRSSKAIIVGDPLQIEPVITLSEQTCEQYRNTAFLDKGLYEHDYHRFSPEEIDSATSYHRAAGASEENSYKGQGISLREHYRCQASIIGYCDKIVGYNLCVKTKPISSPLQTNLIAYHVEGNMDGKVNYEEIDAVCDLIRHLTKKEQGYSLQDIGIISAFRHQANALENVLRSKFPKLEEKAIGTVHTFQGSEKKIIIFSAAASRSQDKQKINWINRRPNLLNVAVSRAKELFILIGNLYRLEKCGSYTRQLVEHIREQGRILEYKSEKERENPYQSSSSSIIFDCEHLDYFRKAIQEVKKEITIVTPWIRGDEPKQFANNIISILQKGIKVTVVYGYLSPYANDVNNDDNDAQAEKILKDLRGLRLVRSRSTGTNQRILLWDDQFAVVGSWNWLSHPYRDSCDRSLLNPSVQICHETSVFICDDANILSLKEDIDTFIQEQI